jgi:hypothetical protein
MFEETNSVLNNESFPSYKSFRQNLEFPYMQNSYCDHRNFDSIPAFSVVAAMFIDSIFVEV